MTCNHKAKRIRSGSLKGRRVECLERARRRYQQKKSGALSEREAYWRGRIYLLLMGEA